MNNIYLGNEFNKEKPMSITKFKATKSPPKNELPIKGSTNKPVNIFRTRSKQLVEEAKAFKPKNKITRYDNQNKRQKVSLKQLGTKVGKQALVAKALDRSVDQEESDLNLFNFSDDSSDEELQSEQVTKKMLPKKKAPVRGSVKGRYYLDNKVQMDKAGIALQKIKKLSLKKNQLKSCNLDQVRNPNTKRCVKRNSKKGKQIAQGTLPPKKSSKYIPKYAHVPVGSVVRLPNGRCMEKRASGRMVFTRLTKEDCKNNY